MTDLASPEDIAIITGEAVELSVRPTSFALRALGTIIDLVAEVIVFVGLLFGALRLGDLFGDSDVVARTLSIVALVLAFIIGPTIVETALGKLAVGARIVRDDGGGIGLRHAFIRALMGLVDIVFSLGSIAALTGLLNRRSKRLGDLLAGTISQQERVPEPPLLAVGVPESLAAWAATADVARMPDRLSRRIAAFLRQASQMTDASRVRLAAALAAEAAPFVAPLPDAQPELLLAAVASIRRDREFRALLLERERFERLRDVLTTNPHGFPDR